MVAKNGKGINPYYRRAVAKKVAIWLWVKTNGIPFWLVGEFTNHFGNQPLEYCILIFAVSTSHFCRPKRIMFSTPLGRRPHCQRIDAPPAIHTPRLARSVHFNMDPATSACSVRMCASVCVCVCSESLSHKQLPWH